MIAAEKPESINITDARKNKYLPAIDGLRAFAVVAVIINHFNKDLLPSGYLGVDIFFVISGYVITSSLANGQSKNFLDFVTGFYARRIKRLVPALVVFILITSVLICLFNPDPKIALSTGKSSLFGLSNIYLYWLSTDYFAQSTELNPFTHTWSLGVEEQFYLLFPFLIWLSGFGRQAKNGARNLFLWIGALTVVSLTSFIYLYQVNQPAAYFLMPPRFWEMAAGCLIFIGFQKRAKIQHGLEQVPPLMVVAAMVGVMFLPIAAAVPATISIVILSAILIACLKSGTAAFSAFTNERVVYIGLISYSLYLWHWTVLCISRWTIGISWWSTPILLGIIGVLAGLSYEYLEQPIRKKDIKNRIITLFIGLSALVATAFLGRALATPSVASRLKIIRDDDGIFQRGRKSQEDYVGPFTKRKNKDCAVPASNLSQFAIKSSLKRCLWEGKNIDMKTPVIGIIGDSHAHQLFPIAENIAKEKGLSVYNYAYHSCLVPQDPKEIDDKCLNVNKVPMWVHQELRRPVIFIVASISDPLLHFPSEAMQKKRVEEFQMSFKEVLDKGNYLIVVAPNPKFLDIKNTISDICGRGAWTKVNPDCSREFRFVAKTQRDQRRIYLEELRKWSLNDKRVAIVDPFDILCGEERGYCHSSANGQAKYWDFSHLNLGAVQSTYPLFKSTIERVLLVNSDSLTGQ